MEQLSPLEALQGLQQDLIALLDSRLSNVNRLEEELNARLDDFRKLLERNRRNEQSRKAIRDAPADKAQPQLGSVITVDGHQYAVSEDFKSAIYTVADEVDLDELEAAKLCLAVQDEVDTGDETLPFRALLRFHNQRQTLLECLRLIFKRVAEGDKEDDDYVFEYLQDIANSIVQGMSGQQVSSSFFSRCCDTLQEIEDMVKKTHEQLIALSNTGRSLSGPHGEGLQAQRMFLARQHESLASTMCYIIRSQRIAVGDYRRLIKKASTADTHLDIISHYAPAIIAGATYFGAGDAIEDSVALELHKVISPGSAHEPWTRPDFQAAVTLWWLVEYSARHADLAPAVHDKKTRLEEARRREELFFKCLELKGFHFMLAISDFLKPEVWHDPAKAGLVRFLLDNSIQFQREAVAPTADFARLTMDQLQNFTEAFISYMPDVLRQLKSDEDEKRRNLVPSNQSMYEMHLERFLLIVAYAYQDDGDAAMEFWSDTESNLYGFLRWTSKRLPTPRVAAFCEVMRALANEERTADHAHRFLLEEGSAVLGRTRKAYSVSWVQIFSELELYAASFQNRPAVTSPTTSTANNFSDPDVAEAETPIMLEAYLRLAAHIIGNSQQARTWILREQPFRLHDTLLQLAQSNTLAPVQACCFNVLAALLTDKSIDINDGVWLALDSWISGGVAAGAGQLSQPKPARPSEKDYLQRIATDAEVATAFVNLLNALVVPLSGVGDLTLDALPFPEQIGTSSRRSGIDAYVDFVFSQALLSSSDPSVVGDRMQMSVLRHACLTFAQLCLETFNDDLVDLVKSRAAEALTTKLKPFDQYSRLHPFTRTIEYMFNDRVVAVLIDTARQNPDELETLTSHSPLVQAASKAVEVMNLVMVKQMVYFDVVRPKLATQLTRRGGSVANPAISSFDDIITSHLDLTLYLVDYAACNHIELALTSLKLLERMSSSTKITGFSDGSSSLRDGHRLISKLENYSEAVQVDLRQAFIVRIQDLEDDLTPVSYPKAKAILSLLDVSLNSNPERPSIAHALLGFQCNAASVTVAPGTLFAQGKSLFHYIAEAAINLPSEFNGNHFAWLQTLRGGCVKLLTNLASANLTGAIVLEELRGMDYLAALQATTLPVSQDALWDGVSAADPTLLLSDGAQTLVAFLAEREHVFDYAVKELQSTSATGIASAQDKVVSILSAQGSDNNDGSGAVTSVFQLFDFFDLKITHPLDASLKYLSDIDASSLPSKDGTSYSIQSIRQLLILKKRELWQNGTIKDQNEEQALNDEIAALITSLESQNKYLDLRAARYSALESWIDLLSALIEQTASPALAQQALQIVIPRLDLAFREDVEAAAQLAKLALVLVRVIGRTSTGPESAFTRGSRDQLILVFRSCVRATVDNETDLGLRDVCYRISCSIISTLITSTQESSVKQRQQLVSHIHDVGDRIVRVVAEDAFSGRGGTRISALLFLDTIVKLSAEAGRSTSVLRSLSKVNFVPVLIDTSIGSVAATFRNSDVETGSSLAYFHTASALLLRMAQLPDGPQLILRSNFISAVEESGLFSTDPDIGLDIDNPEALQAFYRLLSAIVRILVAIVIRRGSGDGSVIQIARRFLTDNRLSISAIFKLTSKQSSARSENSSDAANVATELGRLILVTGFLDEDEAASSTTNGFHFS